MISCAFPLYHRKAPKPSYRRYSGQHRPEFQRYTGATRGRFPIIPAPIGNDCRYTAERRVQTIFSLPLSSPDIRFPLCTGVTIRQGPWPHYTMKSLNTKLPQEGQELGGECLKKYFAGPYQALLYYTTKNHRT